METSKRLIISKSGKYEVIRKLGEGYTGEVFLVKDLQRGEPVALKLLNSDAFKEGQLKAFKREFMLLSDLHHPHVCKVYDFGLAESENRYFFTQELIQGTDLYTYTAGLSVDEIEELFVQIADALGFIHATGLIHFDIKGQNILITTAGEKPLAKVVDFGLAAPSVDTPENIAGTIRYICPEMITKSGTIDYRADLYSLGIVLYRMLAGDYPRQGSTMQEVLEWHTSHTAVDRKPLEDKNVPKYLIDVIEKLTRVIPSERFSSASVVIKYIELHSGKKYTKTQRNLVMTLMEEGPLVARDQLMFKIRPLMAELSQKRFPEDAGNQVMVVTGPAGSGKTRILKELKYITQLNELNTIQITGETNGQNLDAFKNAFGIADTDSRGIMNHLHALQPVVIMVDDLDECAPAVRDIISGIASSLYSIKFMGSPDLIYMMATATTSAKTDPIPIPLHLGVDHEHLLPFTREDIVQYIRLALGESNPPPKQIEDIFNYSGGIPELVKTAIASLETSTARLTKNLDQLFFDKVKKLSTSARRLLGFIALSSRPLTQQDMIILTGETVDNTLTELTMAGIILYNNLLETYSLATGAISIAAKTSLTDDEKKEFSKKLLDHFETAAPDDIDGIVKYALETGDSVKATEYLIKAAEKKEALSEMEAAYNFYFQAVSKMKIDDERMPGALRKMARYLILTGKHDDALKDIDNASNMTSVTTDDLTSKSWIYRLTHHPEKALEYVDQAILRSSNNENRESDVEYIRLMNEKAQCLMQLGKFDEAHEIYLKTNDLALKLPEEKRIEIANNNLGLTLSRKDEVEKAIAFYKNKYELFAHDRRLSASILSQLAYVYQKSDMLTDGLETFKKSWELYSSIGDTHSSMTILANIICICQSMALFSDALDYVKESIALASRTGSEKELASNFLMLGSLYINLGLEDVAQRYLKESASIFQKYNDRHMEAWVQLSYAYLYKNLGRAKEALAYLQNVVNLGKSLKMADLVMWGAYGMADIQLDVGKIDEAEKNVELIEMKWPGKDKARENDIKIELLKCRYSTAKEERPSDDVVLRLTELATLASEKKFRELTSEIYHALSTLFQKRGEPMKSAEYVAHAKEILDDIAGTLSEEYRESFLKQKFRQTVTEDSIKLQDYISQIDIKYEPKKKEDKTGDTVPSAVIKPPKAFDEQSRKMAGETSVLSEEPAAAGQMVIGQSKTAAELVDLIESLSENMHPIFIYGEDGTGKEFIAGKIHSTSVKSSKAFVKIDCINLADDILLTRINAMNTAKNGTIFLEHIEKISSSAQKQIRKIAAQSKKEKDLPSFIMSSPYSLDELRKEYKLRRRMKTLLKKIVIHLPPLKERRTDIPVFINYFLEKITKEKKFAGTYTVEPQVLKTLINHTWPGNIAELEQVLRNACTFSKDGTITEEQVGIYLNTK